MNIASMFFREHSLTKVAAIFNDGVSALTAADKVKKATHVPDRQVQIVHPYDRDWGRKVEPEGIGILRTAIRSHVVCGAIGFAGGLLLFLLLYSSDVTAIVTSPWMSLVALLLIPTMLGLMVGGLLTIRPDHDAVVIPVRDAVAEGHWAVVVHPASRTEMAGALEALETTGAPVSRTL
jgi:hypothetical protein